MFGKLFSKKSKKKSKQESGVCIELKEGFVILGNAQNRGERTYQEDSFGFSDMSENVTYEKGVLAVLADGMGGLENGKEVSEETVSSILNWFNLDETTICTGHSLKEVVGEINSVICEKYCEKDVVKSGSTVVVVNVNNGYLNWFCVGDSRLYIKRNGRLFTVNEDGDYFNQLLNEVIEGKIPFSEACSAPQKDSLAGCIGNSDFKTFDYSKKGYKLENGDILMLCSDGVYNALSEEELCENVTSDAMAACKKIINIVESKKFTNQDNNTVIIISYQKKGD